MTWNDTIFWSDYKSYERSGHSSHIPLVTYAPVDLERTAAFLARSGLTVHDRV